MGFNFTLASRFHDRLGKQGITSGCTRTARTSRPVSRAMSPRTSGTSPRMRSAPINKCRASATAMTSNGLRQTQTARSSSWAIEREHLAINYQAIFRCSYGTE